MALHRIKDFDPDYKNHFEEGDLKGLDVYSGAEKVGSVEDILVDESGGFRYLVINTGAWIFGKKVLLPIGRARVDAMSSRVEATNLTKSQVEALPEFKDDMTADYEHEEHVRQVYRPNPSMSSMGSTSLDNATPLDNPAALGVGYAGYESAPATANTAPNIDTSVGYQGYDRDTYSYDHDPDLYQLHDEGQQSLKLYQERLVANKVRQKTGEVSIGKHVQTETASVSVPVERERVVIQRNAVASGATVAPGEATFQEGEVARMEVYEETADIRKEAFVREEVRVQKVVDQDTVTADEQVRREELDIDTEGHPTVGQPQDANRRA
jgi:uncharacterized protein (TIGR02271 family)